LIAAAILTAFPAFAQTTPPPADVTFTLDANMQTLKHPDDGNARDIFSVELKDAQVDTIWNWACTSGRDTFGGLGHADKICGFQGGSAGKVRNPKKADTDPTAWIVRTQFQGQFTVSKDGTTDMSTMSINYLPNGKPATFGGSMNLKPELTSGNAFTGLKDTVLKKLQLDSSTPIDTRVDTIDWNRVYVPSAGLPSDKGCTWENSHAAFPYQTFAWYLDLKATCVSMNPTTKQDETAVYSLSGNMPFIGDNTVEGDTSYNLVLTLGGGDAQTDADLFVDSSDDSLFADVTGITGTITMHNSQIASLTLDGAPIKNPVLVKAEGKLSGSGVPLQVVRSLAMLIGMIPGTFVGP